MWQRICENMRIIEPEISHDIFMESPYLCVALEPLNTRQVLSICEIN